MDESRQSSSGVLPPALCGFLLLLALIFAASYAVGSGAGPIAPGMHGSDSTGDGGTSGTGVTGETGNGSGGTGDMGDMGGMDMRGEGN